METSLKTLLFLGGQSRNPGKDSMSVHQITLPDGKTKELPVGKSFFRFDPRPNVVFKRKGARRSTCGWSNCRFILHAHSK